MARLQIATRPARLYRPRFAPGRLPLEAPRRARPFGRRLHIRMRRAGPDAATTIPAAQEVCLSICPLRTIPPAAATPRHPRTMPRSLFQKITCLVEGTLQRLVRCFLFSVFCLNHSERGEYNVTELDLGRRYKYPPFSGAVISRNDVVCTDNCPARTICNVKASHEDVVFSR